MELQKIIEQVNSNVIEHQVKLTKVVTELVHNHESTLKNIGDEITVESVIDYVTIDKILVPKYDIFKIRQHGDPLPKPSNGIYQTVKSAIEIFTYNKEIIVDVDSMRLISKPEEAIIQYCNEVIIREFSKNDSQKIYADLYYKVISAIDQLRHEVEKEENSDIPF